MELLSSKDKAELRGYAQRLKPAVHVGKNGVTQATVAELERAFSKDELIKVAFRADRTEMDELVSRVESETNCQCVGGVGKKRSFYRKLKAETDGESSDPWS